MIDGTIGRALTQRGGLMIVASRTIRKMGMSVGQRTQTKADTAHDILRSYM